MKKYFWILNTIIIIIILSFIQQSSYKIIYPDVIFLSLIILSTVMGGILTGSIVTAISFIYIINHYMFEKNNVDLQQLYLFCFLVSISFVTLIISKQKDHTKIKSYKNLSEIDGLTKINNRRSLTNYLINEIVKKQNISFIIFDVDHFKLLNDNYGHQIGDDVLIIIAQIAKDTIREQDFIARYGGEEFAVVLPKTDKKTAINISERIRQNIENYPWKQKKVTSSFGVSTKAEPYNTIITVEHLIEWADKALYYSKQNGRNKTTHYEHINT